MVTFPCLLDWTGSLVAELPAEVAGGEAEPPLPFPDSVRLEHPAAAIAVIRIIINSTESLIKLLIHRPSQNILIPVSKMGNTSTAFTVNQTTLSGCFPEM